MSYDSWLVIEQARRWHDAKFLSLPTHPLQPVLWVNPDDKLCIYHPALQMNPDGVTPPFSWDDISFQRIVRDIRRNSEAIVGQKADKLGVPASYYSSFVDTCKEASAKPHVAM